MADNVPSLNGTLSSLTEPQLNSTQVY